LIPQISWNFVPIKNILTYLDEKKELDDEKEYITITIKRNHGGLEEREKLFGYEIKTKKQFKLVPNSFILSRIQCWFKAFAIIFNVKPNMIASVNYDQFSISKKINRKFFWWLTHSSLFVKTIRNSAKGVDVEKLVFDRNSWLEKKIPISFLEEDQNKIVKFLEQAYSQTEDIKKYYQYLSKKLNLLESSIFKKFREELLLANYTVVKIGKTFDVKAGSTPSRSNPTFWDGGIPWIKTGELKDNDIFESEEKITKQGLEEIGNKLFPENTVLIAMYGQGQTRGRTGRLRIKSSSNQACCAILPHEKFESLFVQYWLRSLYQEMRLKTREGSQPNWNAEMIKEIEIPIIPKPKQLLETGKLEKIFKEIIFLKNTRNELAKKIQFIIPSTINQIFPTKIP